MADLQDLNDTGGFIDRANDAVVSNPVSPESSLVTDQCLAAFMGVVEGPDGVVHVVEDASLPGAIYSTQLLLG